VSRKRYLSTNVSTDPRVRDLAKDAGEFAALLYTWMIPHAADDGMISADPDELLMLVVPGFRWRTRDDVQDATQAMERLGLLLRVDCSHFQFPPTAFYRYQAYVKADRRRTPEQPAISGLFPELPGTSTESLASSSFSSPVSFPVPESVSNETPGGVGGKTEPVAIVLVDAPPSEIPEGDTPPPVDRVLEVYQHFKERIQPNSRLCPRDKLRSRLKRFTAEELLLAIDHFADDSWWMENNATRGADWFFHSDHRIEQFVNMRPRPVAMRTPARGSPAVQPYGGGGAHSWLEPAMVPSAGERRRQQQDALAR
jgi:hypothetical protein